MVSPLLIRGKRQASSNPFDNPPAPSSTLAPSVKTPAPQASSNPFDAPVTSGPATRTINDGGATVTVKTFDTSKVPAPPKKRDDPIRRLNIDIQKMTASMPGMTDSQRVQAQRLIAQVSQGNPVSTEDAKAWQQRQALTPGDLITGYDPREGNAPVAPGTLGAMTAAGEVMRNVSRPFQAVASGVGEWSRQAESTGNHLNLGPIHIPLTRRGAGIAAVGNAIRQGWDLKRHDTPSSIIAETAAIRRSHGESVGPLIDAYEREQQHFPGGKVLVPLVTDMAVGAALDPLSYMTFGLNTITLRSLETVEKLTDAATAERVAREGLDALNPAQRVLVDNWLGPKGIEAIERNHAGGIGVRVPFGTEVGRTVIPTAPVTDALRDAFRAAETTPGILGVPARAARTVGETAANIFLNRAALARRLDIGGEALARDLNSAGAAARGYQHFNEDLVAKQLFSSGRKALVTPEEARSIVGPALDIGGTGVVADPRLQPLVDTFKKIRQDMTDENVLRGRLLEDQFLSPGAVHTENYFPRVRTPEGDALFGQKLQELGQTVEGVGVNDPFLQARQLERGMSVREINAALSAELGRPIEYFHEDPFVAFGERARSMYGSIAKEDYYTSLMGLTDPEGNRLVFDLSRGPNNPQSLPRPVTGGPVSEALARGHRDIPLAHVEVDIVDPLTHERITVAVPKEVGELVKRTSDLLNDPTELAGLYNQFLNWWKTMATVPIPFGIGFHLRNAESNFALNWMSGVGVGMADYAKAAYLQRAMNRGIKDTGDWRQYLTAPDRYLMEQAYGREVLDAGWYGDLGEISQSVGRGSPYSPKTLGLRDRVAYYLKRANPLSTEGVPATLGRRVGQGIEENARLAHFLAVQRQTGDFDAAANSVRRWLFDYHDVTASEQQIKKLIPFYTWARKSTSAAIDTVIHNPRKLAQFNRLKDSITNIAGVDLSHTLVPGYVSQNPTSTPIGVAGRGLIGRTVGAGQAPGTPLIASPDLPINTPVDIANMAYGGLRAIPGLNNVLPATPGSEPMDAVRTAIGMVGGPAGVLKAAAEDLAGVNFFSGAPIRDEYVPSPTPLNWIPGMDQISAKTRNLVNAAWPTGTKIEGAYPNDPADKDKQVRRLVSMLTGLPVNSVGLTTQQAEAYRRLEPVMRFIKAMQAAGVMPA